VTYFFILPQPHLCNWLSYRHFKFRVLIDTGEYECINDILPPKWMGSESRDFFKFWEITANISETVQDTDIVAMQD